MTARKPMAGPIAGADANPYLAIAASLAAGMLGMEQAQSPTEPVDDSADDQDHGLP